MITISFGISLIHPIFLFSHLVHSRYVVNAVVSREATLTWHVPKMINPFRRETSLSIRFIIVAFTVVVGVSLVNVRALFDCSKWLDFEF